MPNSLRIYKRLIQRLRPQKSHYLLICTLGLVLAGLEMIPPYIVGSTVNLMSREHFELSQVFLKMLLWGGAAVIIQVLHGWQIAMSSRCGERVIRALREDLFAHLQKLSMRFYDQNQVGRLLACFGDDLNSLLNLSTWGFNTITSNLAFLVFSSAMIYLSDAPLFWATVWLAPTLTLLTFIQGQRVHHAWIEARLQASRVGANQAENIAGSKVVTAFNRQDQNLSIFDELQKTNSLSHVRASRISGIFQPWLQGIRFTGQAIILLYGGYRVARGHLSPGNLVSASLYWEWFMMPAMNFGGFMNELLISSSAAARIYSVLDETPEVQDRPGARPLGRVQGHVRFANVTFSYLPGRDVLHGIDFEVEAGTTVALIGATGSGKTTILSLLARLYEPQQGRILIDGQDIGRATLSSLHAQIKMVLQKNFLFNGTIMENLRFALPHVSDEEVYQAAQALGCHDWIRQLKEGYHTSVGDQGSGLSQGQRQLICFVRALIAQPRILLLDEATSALDPNTDHQIQKALRRLSAGRTTLIVTHRLSTAQQADVILVLSEGRLVERGTHTQLLSNGGTYARLYFDSVRKIPEASRTLLA